MKEGFAVLKFYAQIVCSLFLSVCLGKGPESKNMLNFRPFPKLFILRFRSKWNYFSDNQRSVFTEYIRVVSFPFNNSYFLSIRQYMLQLCIFFPEKSIQAILECFIQQYSPNSIHSLFFAYSQSLPSQIFYSLLVASWIYNPLHIFLICLSSTEELCSICSYCVDTIMLLFVAQQIINISQFNQSFALSFRKIRNVRQF